MSRFNTITFYGERGVVNSIVLQLDKDIKLAQEFLSRIRFNNGHTPSWIKTIKSVHYFVEISFGEFGDPDLMILCEDIEGDRHLVFIEAKLVCYDNSAVDLRNTGNTSTGNISSTSNKATGINSRINAQLTLKHRLSLVLQKRGTGEELEEAGEIFDLYKDLPTEFKKKARRVIKKEVIAICDKHFTSVKDFWFVAMTNDTPDYKPYIQLSNNPLILDEAGQTLTDHVGNNFGIITYTDINKIKGLDREELPKPSIQNLSNMEALHLRTVNWSEFDCRVTDEIKSNLEEMVLESINKVKGQGKVIRKQYSGSVSYLVDGRTIIKLVPINEKMIEGQSGIMLAVIEDFIRAAGVYRKIFDERLYSLGVGKNSRNFVGRVFQEVTTEEYDEWVLNISYVLETVISQ